MKGGGCQIQPPTTSSASRGVAASLYDITTQNTNNTYNITIVKLVVFFLF